MKAAMKFAMKISRVRGVQWSFAVGFMPLTEIVQTIVYIGVTQKAAISVFYTP